MLFKKHNEKRAKSISQMFSGLINSGDKVIDIGLGNGIIAKQIKDAFGADIEGVDVVDYNNSEIKNTIYDGLHLPFEENSFDSAIILETLHHCNDMIQVLKETRRVVRKKVIILEDIYENLYEKYTLLFHDYISNARKGVKCPYYFQTKERWREIFSEIGLKIVSEKHYLDRFLIFPSRHVMYVLGK